MTSLRTGFILAAILVATSVQAQSPQPYGIATFGEFRKMAMQRDYAAKATLAAVVANGATDGVGAVTDARGEVTIVDGKAIVSYGKETDRLPPASETEMLLAIAAVREWQEVRVSRDVKPAEIESFLGGRSEIARHRPGEIVSLPL